MSQAKTQIIDIKQKGFSFDEVIAFERAVKTHVLTHASNAAKHQIDGFENQVTIKPIYVHGDTFVGTVTLGSEKANHIRLVIALNKPE